LRTSLEAAFADIYVIVRELGRGGAATVYLARDIKHDRIVALKVLRPEVAASLGPERFLREISLTAHLPHPHILPLYDSGERAGFLYYTMPFVEGESLRQRLSREGQLPVAEALRIGAEVADALGHAHKHGVVHRDIKPGNILLEAGHAVLADFGVAKAVRSSIGMHASSSGMVVGTPAYMSPEQAAAAPQVDGRADVYSLGCVVYEMLAGVPPFTGPSVQAILAGHATGQVPPLRTLRSAVTRDMESAIAKALAKVPADRYASAEDFARALQGPPSGAAAASHPRWARLLVVVVLLVVLAYVAFLLVRWFQGG